MLSACNTILPSPTPAPTLNAPQARGKALYEQNCQSCHRGATGGTMMDLPPKHNANGHTWHHGDCVLTAIVLNGPGEMGPMMEQMMGQGKNIPKMPAFQGKLSRDDVNAILAYIKTWWTDSERAYQAQITEQMCPVS
ncbi:MAG TPA: cytochrome c [Anaerolineae bacterium]|nr:cytochrome c [Anaerolineae bacterium]